MPYRTMCGIPVKEADKFCPACGTPVAKFTMKKIQFQAATSWIALKSLCMKAT